MCQILELHLKTAGGKITCRRCQAKSRRTQRQCAKPALKGKAVCQFHGGRSTGPRTQNGKQRVRAAHIKHGQETLQAKAERSAKSLMFRYLQEIGNYAGLFPEPLRLLGRPPLGYQKLDLNDPIQLVIAIEHLSK